MLANRVWIDLEDLFKYANLGLRPSGIQRLEFELCRALHALPESKGRVFFVRHDARQCLIVTPWEAVEALFDAMSSDRPESKAIRACSLKTPGAEGGAFVRTAARSALRNAAHALPPSLRKIVRARIDVFIGSAELIRVRAVRVARALRRYQKKAVGASSASPVTVSCETTDHFAAMARPGDILAVLGAAWIAPDFVSYIDRARREKGLRLALLVYDIIPLRRTEWFNEMVVEAIRRWFDGALPLADMIFTISAATARDVTAYARSAGLALRAVPTPIPIGSGFKKSNVSQRSARDTASGWHLPAPNSYALVVSTIEVRKNHALLFQVWRRLLEEMAPDSVPTLVFAGRVGWQVCDLMDQLHNSRFLDGKIIHIESPTDEELEALYDGCLFTLFPSFFEGWGLPVTESLTLGRPCIISNTTSLPEAGGSLARYIDPDNITGAYHVIRQTIQDRAGLREWRDRVRREFKPVEWRESAHAVLKVLDIAGDAPRTWETEVRPCGRVCHA